MTDLLDVLRDAAERSDCARVRFGAAALDAGGAVLALGWNHNPLPTTGYSCAQDCAGGIRALVRSGTCIERCYAVHAEQHAILKAGPGVYEVAVAGWLPEGSLFDNGGGFYCTVCSRIMAAAGVSLVSIWSRGERKRLTVSEAWTDSYRIVTG